VTGIEAGVLWAAVAGLAFGIGQIANRGVNRRMPAIAASTAMLTAVLVALIIASVVIGDLGELQGIPAAAAGWYAVATVVHFGVGWTLFVVSQQRIGPSRTASVLSTNPVMAALVAAAVISEQLRSVTWLGVILVTAGVGLVASSQSRRRGATGAAGTGAAGADAAEGASAPGVLAGLWPALAATFMFSVSPLPVREGLARFAEPRLGLLVGLIVTVPLMHLATRVMSGRWVPRDPIASRWLVLGGSAAALAIAAQWTALDLIPVGAAISLQQLNTPTVLFLGPILLRAPRERPTPRMLLGAALVLTGAVLVAMFGRAAG
jgi:drug/metabolite transporter (DMT)-like permease